MQAFQEAQSFIDSHAEEPDAAVLRLLIDRLRDDEQFALGQLYELQHDRFQLAMQLLQDWRLRRYWMGKEARRNAEGRPLTPSGGGEGEQRT